MGHLTLLENVFKKRREIYIFPLTKLIIDVPRIGFTAGVDNPLVPE